MYEEQLQVVRAAVETKDQDMANRLLTVNLAGKAEFEDVPPGH